MNQVKNNLLVLGPGDQIPDGTEDALKIYLSGTVDLSGNEKFMWQEKFINGMSELVDQEKGLIMFKKYNYIIFNPYYVPQNPAPHIMNPEFTNLKMWETQCLEVADGIFCNFLKRSTSAIPLFEFGYTARSGKLVVRCPEEYQNYALVKFYCENFNIPLLPGKTGSILSVLQSLFAYCPKFQELGNSNLMLPE